MRALAGFAVLIFFGLLGAIFVVGLSGIKGSDPRLPSAYYLGFFAAILLLAAVLGTVGSLATLANPGPDRDDIEIQAPKEPREPGLRRGPADEFESRRIADVDDENETNPPRRRVVKPGVAGWESRYSAGVGLLASLILGAAALWLLRVASNLADRNLFTGKPKAVQPASEVLSAPGATRPEDVPPNQ